MNYYLDTEFLEGSQTKRLLGIPIGKTEPTVDLISIGIISQDGREYYAISKDFNLKEAWNRWQWNTDKNTCDIVKKIYWIRENVLKPIYEELCSKRTTYEKTHHWGLSEPFSYKSMKYLISKYGKSNTQIAQEIYDFVNPDLGFHIAAYNNSELRNPESYLSEHFEKHDVEMVDEVYIARPTFYGYYSAYDHVVFCWLFGKMIDLPKGFPMYTRDLKQLVDSMYMNQKKKYEGVNRLDAWLLDLKNHPDYPHQESSKAHNALEDARWNKKFYEFLNKNFQNG